MTATRNVANWAEKLEQAKPITPSGEVKLDVAKVEARHDAQVRNAFKYGTRCEQHVAGSKPSR